MRGERFSFVRIVVAAYVVEAFAERVPVGLEECVVLLFDPPRREIALRDDGVRLDRGDIGDCAAVHHLGIRVVALLGLKDGPEFEPLHHAALGLAEMHVVDRRKAAQ